MMDIMCRVEQDLDTYIGSLKEGYQPRDYRNIDFDQCQFTEHAFNKRLREACLDEIGDLSSASGHVISCINQMRNKIAEFVDALIADDASGIYDMDEIKSTTYESCLLSIMMGDEHFRKTTFETFQ